MTIEYKQLSGTSLEIFTKEILEHVAEGWTLDEGYPANAIWCYEAYMRRVTPDVGNTDAVTSKVGRPKKEQS